MRRARILYKNEEAGVLTHADDGAFLFKYHEEWLNNPSKPAIALSLPKVDRTYFASYLFPFFYHMLPEGTNKRTVCFNLRIDASDYFGLLMATAAHDTIGAVRVIKMEDE